MAVRLFVGNLPYDVTEADLRAHFAAVGPLSYISLPTDRETGRPRGFAFVEFIERADAEEANSPPSQSGVPGQTAGGERSASQGKSCNTRHASSLYASSLYASSLVLS